MGQYEKIYQGESIWTPSRITGLSGYSSDVLTYGEFRRNLRPNFLKSVFPLFSSLFCILFLLFISSKVRTGNIVLTTISITFLSFLLGLVAHRQLLLVHEGAHFHLAKKRRINDLLANVFAGIFVGAEIKSYRFIHNKHHMNLGTDQDPENSYSDEFDFTWLLTALFGIRTLKTFFRRKKIEKSTGQLIMIIFAIFFHISVVAFLISKTNLFVSATWLLGYFVFMPSLGSIRNVLEHKFQVDDMRNFTLEATLPLKPDHTTRMFTKVKSSRLLGVVGFDRHLIHHWDPTISAANLERVHSFLLETELGPMLEALPTTYFRAFMKLIK